ncbi:histidine-type phosphatase [Micromonospora sp. NPDC048999]|uniref:histidine-type phosphatase n=1 Tax=Micromonospora sp. NPDC048999 TaxID=3155391 RepID=UPI0033CA6386
MKRLARPLAVLAAALVISSSGTASAAAVSGTTQPSATSYGTKLPYTPQQNSATYQAPPSGFKPVFTEHVARHGSRGLSSKKYDDLALQVWKKAKSENSLTDLGTEFGPAVQALMTANEKLGYGNLTTRGVQEHRDLAARVYRRLPALFNDIPKKSNPIVIVTSGVDRAVDSGRNFGEGLAAADPAVASLIQAPQADPDLLYFHKSSANAAYQNYLNNDPRLKNVLRQIQEQPRSRTVARDLLEGLFTPAFVDRLAAGEFDFVDSESKKTHVRNEVDAALVIYNLYLITPGMRDEGDWRFERFVPVEDAEWLGYLADAEDFYGKGPGFAGDDISFRMATVLLDDFFAKLEAAKGVGIHNRGAVFRFTHAEEIIPLAALMGLPGSTQQMPEGTLYTYENNPWRGALVSPMGANIQWDMFQRGNQYIVRMLYNEKETDFKAACKPISAGSYFYDLTELERCFGRRTAG